MSPVRPSEDERARRRTADRERIERAARDLLTSDGWRRWVKIRSTNGLARYSFNNQLLIALQRPDATFVAGFRRFLELDRCVRKGEKAIRILAPMTLARRSDGAGRDEEAPRRTVFRAVSVFDVAQTDTLPGRESVPLEPPTEPITGASHAHLVGPLQDLARELGYSVSVRTMGSTADGWCDHQNRMIVINAELPRNAQVRVLVHEIAHALGIGYHEYGRHKAEVLVDTVTCIVCGSIGLDVSGSSVPYVAGWGEDGALEAVRRYAETVDTVAGRIESALAPSASEMTPADA